MDSFEKLKQTKALFDEGIITEEEYLKLKDRLMAELEKEHSAQPAKPATSNATAQQVKSTPAPASQVNQSVAPVQPVVVSDKGADTGMKVLSFLIPLVGLILFLVNQNTKPVEAKDELKWAAIGFGVGIMCYVLMVGCAASSYY